LDYLTTHTSLSPIRLCKLQKGCTRLAAASDKVYQLLAHGRHDIAEILLKVALNTENQSINQQINIDIV